MGFRFWRSEVGPCWPRASHSELENQSKRPWVLKQMLLGRTWESKPGDAGPILGTVPFCRLWGQGVGRWLDLTRP